MINAVSTGRRLIHCTAGSYSYCLDHDWVESVHGIESLYPGRGADGSVGWIRRAEQKVPVYRLTDRVEGLAHGRVNQGSILVLRRDGRQWGLLVDKVGASTEVPYERIFPLPAITGNGNGQFPWVVVEDQKLNLYISPDRIVPADIAGADPQYVPTAAPPPQSNVRANIQWRVSKQGAVDGDRKSNPQLITFMLQQRFATQVRFALSAQQTLEIISNPPMIPVPQAPLFVKGLINWRSLPVPVIDLAAWLGMRVTRNETTPRHETGPRMMVCRGTVGRSRRDPGLIAFAPIEDVRRLDLPIEYRPWPEQVTWNAGLALGVYKQERAMLVVPDLDAILSFQAGSGGYRM